MSVYYYIAQLNPESAYDVCQQNGFTEIFSQEELADTLQVIAASGESGLKQVLSAHPDKEVIVEMFQKKEEPKQNFANASGDSSSSKTTKLVSQTNAFILVGAIIVSLAIISAKQG
jgi:hypothetical protein